MRAQMGVHDVESQLCRIERLVEQSIDVSLATHDDVRHIQSDIHKLEDHMKRIGSGVSPRQLALMLLVAFICWLFVLYLFVGS